MKTAKKAGRAAAGKAAPKKRKPARPRRMRRATYLGYTLFVESAIKGSAQRLIMESFESQVDLIQDIPMKKTVAAFFREQTITVRKDVEGCHSGPRGIFLKPEQLPHIAPILLHELLHAYQARKLRDGHYNKTVWHYYDEARRQSLYPRDSYMLRNVAEFFAMTGCAVLYGRIARAPFTRRHVRTAQPGYYKWLTAHFGLRLVGHH